MQIKVSWQNASHRAIILLLCCLTLCGCIRAEGIQPAPTPTQPVISPVISVAGRYDTAVTLLENNCGPITVEPMLTEVAHEPGETQLILTHAGNHFNGTLQPGAIFATQPLILRGGGATYTVTVTGQFARTGFDALTTIAVQQLVEPQKCQYRVRWVGTKQGKPNVIP